jgi:hypothetical protein
MNEGIGAGRRAPSGPRRAGAGAVLAAAALLAAGCGGGSHGAGPGASPGQGRLQQLTAFAQCMRGHGEPGFYLENRANAPSSGSDDPELSFMGYVVQNVNPGTTQFAAAMKVCKHLMPGGGPQPITQKQINSMVKSAQCMRAHGYPDYPDPDLQNGRPVGMPLPSDIDTSSPQFEKAQNTCHAD